MNRFHERRDAVTFIMVVTIAAAAAIAATTGIVSSGGLERAAAAETHVSVRGESIPLFGNGVYRHMSADVAVQGIGQDVVTLLLGVPLLLVVGMLALSSGAVVRADGKTRAAAGPEAVSPADAKAQAKARPHKPQNGIHRLPAHLALAGIVGYFFVSYLFYMLMGTYNVLFLLYAFLAGMSFFTLARLMLGLDPETVAKAVAGNAPTSGAGIFLIVNALLVAFMWLGVVVPPLFDGTLYPQGLDHYTTLVVQGMDLSILLPLSFVTGIMIRRRTPLGTLLGPVYLVFLSILMVALTAKIVAMAATGVSVIPAVFIIPTITIVAIVVTVRLLRRYS